MGDFSQTLKDYNLSPELVGAAGTAAEIYGTVSGAYAYYGAAHAIGEKLGLWAGGGSDFDRLNEAISKVLEAMRAGFQAVLKGQALQEQHAKIDGLLDLQAPALGALSILKTVPPGGALTPGQIDLIVAQTDCESLRANERWLVTYYPQFAHVDPWSSKLEPPHDGPPGQIGSISAFPIVLPIYLRAIALRVSALAAAFPHPFREPAPGDAALYHQEILDHANKLMAVHDEIRAAIVPLRRPTVAEMLGSPVQPMADTQHTRYWTLRPSAWDTAKRLFGAVETYSTTDAISSFPEPIPPPPDPSAFPVEPTGDEHVPPPNPNAPDFHPPPVSHEQDYRHAFDAYANVIKAFYPRFAARHAVRTLRAQKAVYNAVGLGPVWAAANHLRTMAGEPPVPTSVPADAESVRHGDWSLREFGDRVADAVGTVPVGTLNLPPLTRFTIRAVANLVGVPPAPVVSLRHVFTNE